MWISNFLLCPNFDDEPKNRQLLLAIFILVPTHWVGSSSFNGSLYTKKTAIGGFLMVPTERLELPTHWLQISSSTNWAMSALCANLYLMLLGLSIKKLKLNIFIVSAMFYLFIKSLLIPMYYKYLITVKTIVYSCKFICFLYDAYIILTLSLSWRIWW